MKISNVFYILGIVGLCVFAGLNFYANHLFKKDVYGSLMGFAGAGHRLLGFLFLIISIILFIIGLAFRNKSD